ncbi:MAG: hypothetical protein GF344_12695 [Chitinivibrionales bacterium]|nr:hypothetical protein [Chitinivibrionales bacterium]
MIQKNDTPGLRFGTMIALPFLVNVTSNIASAVLFEGEFLRFLIVSLVGSALVFCVLFVAQRVRRVLVKSASIILLTALFVGVYLYGTDIYVTHLNVYFTKQPVPRQGKAGCHPISPGGRSHRDGQLPGKNANW